MPGGRLTSAKGLLALLVETDATILHFALSRLNSVVDEFWYELANQLALLDELCESDSLPEMTRQQAAMLASRTHFHLGAYDDSVHYAIKAGSLFKDIISSRSDYSDTILGRCIDMYVAHREAQAQTAEAKSIIASGDTTHDQPPAAHAEKLAAEVTPELESMFESLAETWIDSDSMPVRELVGFALRARRADLLKKLLRKHVNKTQSGEMIGFTLQMANKYVRSITFRTEVLRALADLYTTGLSNVDFFSLVDCLLFLEDAKTVATLLEELLSKDKLVAYQIAFDLFEAANQEFLLGVVRHLSGEEQLAPAVETQQQQPATSPAVAADPDSTSDAPPAAPTPAPLQPSSPTPKSLVDVTVSIDPYIKDILLGNVTTQLYVKYLYSQCKADVHVLSQTKKVLPPHNKASILHTATIMSSGFMYCGTTIDGFLRDNLQWLGKATNWSKFIATASVGVVHQGHVDQAMTILKPYLPDRSNVGPLPFQEAGALYALGLIHAGLGSASKESREAVTYLRNALREYNSNEQMVHGAALGLGLVAMGLQDDGLVDALFVCVNGCDAVPGEAAAVGIGLVNLGIGAGNVVNMVLAAAREHNQKEKTIRGLCTAVALMMMGKEGLAEQTIADMVQDRDPWIRCGGCQVLGLAYAGTGNSHAIEALLQVCVRDVSDEVRRTAIAMLGFICLADVDRCVALTRVFADSYNPHVRYGVALALGISAAGSAHIEAVAMLWLLKDDTSDFVRQGAILALSMALIQQPNALSERAKEFRTFLAAKIQDPRADTCTKYGCILAQGIIDACGRNAVIELHRNGHPSKKAVVGVFMFLQYWFWFPFAYLISLAFKPTCILCLTERLEMPEYAMLSKAPASHYAMPPSVLQTKKESKAAQNKTAVLSTTQRQADLKKKRVAEGGSVPHTPTSFKTPTEVPATDESAKEPTEKKEEEPQTEELQNPARVTYSQLSVVEHGHDKRYTPVRRETQMGICMLRDQSPDEPVKIVAVDLTKRKDDVPMPEPFEWP
jgi:26S proteasome regulatory subunit N2